MDYAKAIGGALSGVVAAGALGFSVGLSLFDGGETGRISWFWLAAIALLCGIVFMLIRKDESTFRPGFIIGLCIGLLLVGICFMAGI